MLPTDKIAEATGESKVSKTPDPIPSDAHLMDIL